MLVIGKADKYYTLWNKSELSTRDGSKFYEYSYIKNISMDYDKVCEEYPEIEYNEALRGCTTYREYVKDSLIKKPYNPGVFPFGKYAGKQITVVPVSYLVWFYENFRAFTDTWYCKVDNVDAIEAILEDNGYICFRETYQAFLKENVIDSKFEAPEVLKARVS